MATASHFRAIQLVTAGHASGQSVVPLYAGFDLGRGGDSESEHLGFGERSVDDMLPVCLDIVYLDDAEFNRIVEQRKVRPAATSTGQNR